MRLEDTSGIGPTQSAASRECRFGWSPRRRGRSTSPKAGANAVLLERREAVRCRPARAFERRVSQFRELRRCKIVPYTEW
jgi:hypothetical protein